MIDETVDIKGMHCQSCVKLIESGVGSLEGVESVKVDLIKNNAQVRFDAETISLGEIKKEIVNLGYNIDKEVGGGRKGNNTLMQGLAYGLIPHIGCIAFIIGSVLGVTLLMEFFRPLLMNYYFFHYLVILSLGFATLSSVIYLRKNGFFSLAGIKRKRQYLSVMYGSTVGINLVLFMLIFPLLANVPTVSALDATGNIIGYSEGDLSSAKLAVDIPCPGHAPLISEELQTLPGIAGIQFGFPNEFTINYLPGEVSVDDMMGLEVFKTYKATVLEEANAPVEIEETAPAGCCGSPTCGSSSGGGCGCGGRR
jgi:copper chaperone